MLKGTILQGTSPLNCSPKMNEAWLDDKFKVYSYQPQAGGNGQSQLLSDRWKL